MSEIRDQLTDRLAIANLLSEVRDLRAKMDQLTRAQDNARTRLPESAKFELENSDGDVVARLGGSDTGEVVEYVDGPTPAPPLLEVDMISAGPGAISVRSEGLDVYENPAPKDFHALRVHVSLDPLFEPSDATAQGRLSTPKGVAGVTVEPGLWHVGIEYETKSGKLSGLSEVFEIDVEPLVDTDDIEEALGEAQERLDEYTETIAKPRFEQLETGLGENTENLSAAEKRLSAAESTLSPLPGRITEAESSVAEAWEEATTASAAAVEANNRSMTRLANGNFENGLDYWAYQDVTLSETAHSGSQSAHLAEGGLYPASSFPVVAGQIWELSLYHQGSATVVFESVTDNGRAILDTLTLTGSSGAWADSGALRVTVPANVDLLGFTISSGDALVDDVTLRDVTDVVRLEEAANANRQKAEQAIAEYELLKLAVDGEGGLRERLGTAETVLQDKADTSSLSELDEKLGRDLAAFEAHYTRVWRQLTPPPPGTHYAWLGERHASVSVRLDDDGNETARNHVHSPSLLQRVNFFSQHGVDAISADGPNDLHGLVTVTSTSDSNYVGVEQPAIEPGQWAGLAVDVAWAEGIGRLRVQVQFRAADNTSISAPQFVIDRSESPDGGRFHIVAQAPPGTDFVRPYTWWHAEDSFSHPGEGATVWMDYYSTAIGESESDVLDQLYPYFDGDSVSDRAHDLWYHSDGVPHEWVNGQGWTVLTDARLGQLAEDIVSAKDAAIAQAATDAQTKADAARADAEATAKVHAQLVADGAEEDAIAEADRLHGIAVAAAEAAQTKANEAHEDAGTAQSTADSALTMAGSKSKVTYSTSAPAGTATVGDTHRQQNSTGDIIGEWEYTADGWQKRQVSSEAISNLDVGKLTAGTTEIVEAVINKLWAELGVFGRLEAREGWIGGVNLADNAVTAEKITATREMVTKIFGAEWAYIAERLVVDGEIITQNIDAISAAIEQLTVTERADFAKAFAQEMWAELGVFDKLQAEEAWIGGALIQDDTIDVAKINVTEQLTAAIAQFLEIEAGMIKANAIDGMTITGSTLQTRPEAQQGIKLRAAENDLVAYDQDNQQSFHVDGDTGQLTARGAEFLNGEVIGGYVGTAKTGKRVYLEGDNLTARDSANGITAQIGPGGLALTDPAGNLQNIGPHIYGSYVLNSYEGVTQDFKLDGGGATTYGGATSATWATRIPKVSNRYRINAAVTIDGIARTAGVETYVWFRVNAMSPDAGTEYTNLLSRYLYTGDPMFRVPRCFTIIKEVDWSGRIGQDFRAQWFMRAKGFENAGRGLRVTGIDVEITPI